MALLGSVVVATLGASATLPGALVAAISPHAGAPIGWAAARLPPGFHVGNGADGPTASAIACAPGSTDCVAAMADRIARGAGGRIGSGTIVSTDPSSWSGYSGLPPTMWQVLSLSCPSAAACVAAGTSAGGAPVLASSSDGGRSWRNTTPSPLRRLHVLALALSCARTSACYLVGTLGSHARASGALALESGDGGIGWTQLSAHLPPALGSRYGLGGISCTAAESCVAVGALTLDGEGDQGGVAITTSNGGRSWSVSLSPALAAVAELDAVSCVVGRPTCEAGGSLPSGEPAIAISDDGGRRWAGEPIFDGTGPIASISCGGVTQCWAAGSGDTLGLLGTADLGDVWQPVSVQTIPAEPGSVACAGASRCVAVADGQLLWTSSDGGIRARSGPDLPRAGRVPPGSVTAVVAHPSTNGVSVDPAEATAVATRLWNDRALARHDRDPIALGLVESGEALAVDRPQCISGCPAPPAATLEDLGVAVPRQSGWPASFFAEATFSEGCVSVQSPCVDLFVAIQQAAGRPWTIALVASYGGEPLGFINGSDGYAEQAQPAAPTASLLQDYATFLEAVKQTGQAPSESGLASDGFTDELAASDYLPEATAATLGYHYAITYSPDPGPTYSVLTTFGALQCGAVDYTEIDNPLRGLRLAQLVERSPWGDTTEPGSYRELRRSGVHMACFVSGTNPAGAELQADWSGLTASSGTP